jgi:Fe-Mn family superoxide dismutase
MDPHMAALSYSIAPLAVRPWTLNGIWARLIESHYEPSYGTAVVRLNAVTEELSGLDPKASPVSVVRRL